jgi:hypothetical protein
MAWFETVTDLHSQAAAIRSRRYGVIDVVDGRFARVRLRPWPKIASVIEGKFWGEWRHGRARGDRCSLHYNQPHRFSNFLAAAYAWSSRECSVRTIRTVLRVLDDIAQIKGTDAILCDVIGSDISDRLLERWGWERHAPSMFHRNYIRRFYGNYPAVSAVSHEDSDDLVASV